MLKWFLRFIVLILVLLVVVIFAAYLSLDRIVKSVVQTQGSQQLQVPTTLGGVTLGLFNGTVDLKSLAIGSPPGFSAPEMFSVGSLSVDTGGLSHLRNEPIHVTSITIDQPRLVIEQHGSKLNFKELMDRLPSHPDQGGQTTSTQSKPVKLIIDSLTMTNAHVLLQSDIPGIAKEIDLPLPEIKMTNIGNADEAQNGAAIKDVATAIISKMVDEASQASGIPIDLKGLLSGNLDQVKDKLLDTAQKQLSGLKVPSQVTGLLNNVTGSKGNNTAGNLLNLGLGALGGGTTKPAK
jgi:uncharacterized membrane protein